MARVSTPLATTIVSGISLYKAIGVLIIIGSPESFALDKLS